MLSKRQSLPTLRSTMISLLKNKSHPSEQQVMTTDLHVLALWNCLSLFTSSNSEPKPNNLTTMNDLTLPGKMIFNGTEQRYFFLLDISPASTRTRKPSNRSSEPLGKNHGKSVEHREVYLYWFYFLFIQWQPNLSLTFWYLPNRTEKGQTVTKEN